MVSTHSRPKATGNESNANLIKTRVSTHSRPKATGLGEYTVIHGIEFQHTAARRRLLVVIRSRGRLYVFQHTAARRRLHHTVIMQRRLDGVSTHSRPKATAVFFLPPTPNLSFQHTAARRRLVGKGRFYDQRWVSTHSRPKATAGSPKNHAFVGDVSTHSRPKATGPEPASVRLSGYVSTHSRPKATGLIFIMDMRIQMFQHTAARRRLTSISISASNGSGFNTQPPEGDCCLSFQIWQKRLSFNTQPPEGDCADLLV